MFVISQRIILRAINICQNKQVDHEYVFFIRVALLLFCKEYKNFKTRTELMQNKNFVSSCVVNDFAVLC